MRGKIIKGIAGFYYVHVPSDGVYECRAKGIFRKEQVKPLVGDDVEIDLLDGGEKTGNIRSLLPRSSCLIRPAVANVDQVLVIFAITHPQPNFNLLDRFLIMMRQQGLPCVICLNKQDLDLDGKGAAYADIYASCGYETLIVSASKRQGLERLGELLKGRTTAVAGPSGVGKSSLINCLQSETVMETGEVSAKIERGRHTTRHSELIAVGRDTYILDTPGFSSLSLFDLEKEQLAAYYPEFQSYETQCRFGGCSHVAEPQCAVKQALEQGRISRMRYENYCQLYEELRAKKPVYR
ncbi:MAG: ribosome small subunit-dependent GTPase A [bacterium]|nr:ribosome small subunit-dependent GTPase A [bacterium]MCM1376508.1 ribosome small subunit-dependent GTPase A [Muribaculum sp.]MCM1410840.1 ribosome small subunit-dependent GTPase A [Lachnospiraceae bacterium]